MIRYRVSGLARADIVGILAWSAEHFGDAARRRYRDLIATALDDIGSEPTRPGSRVRPEIGPGIRSWHLRGSRDRSPTPRVQAPRHFLIYRVDDGVVVFGRLLHDAMDIASRVDEQSFSS